jgi:hypothetical protein
MQCPYVIQETSEPYPLLHCKYEEGHTTPHETHPLLNGTQPTFGEWKLRKAEQYELSNM